VRGTLVLLLAVGCGNGSGTVDERRATVTWTARVTAAEGRALTPGDACEIRAQHRSDGAGAVEVALRIACGQTVLYASPAFAAVTPGRRCSTYEEPADDVGTYRYRLECTDATDPRLALDTRRGTAVIDRVGDGAFHVALEVDRTSSINRGEPLHPGNAPRDPGFDAPIELHGSLVEVIGLGAELRGAACTVRIAPRTGRFNCHIRVACGGKPLYGTDDTGFTDCAIAHRRPMRAHDPRGVAEEGDPKLEMDLGRGEVIVSNDDPGATYRARIVVEKTAEQW